MLAKCRECGSEVSSEATSCPNCGVPKPTSVRLRHQWLWNLVGTAVIVWLILQTTWGERIVSDFVKGFGAR